MHVRRWVLRHKVRGNVNTCTACPTGSSKTGSTIFGDSKEEEDSVCVANCASRSSTGTAARASPARQTLSVPAGPRRRARAPRTTGPRSQAAPGRASYAPAAEPRLRARRFSPATKARLRTPSVLTRLRATTIITYPAASAWRAQTTRRARRRRRRRVGARITSTPSGVTAVAARGRASRVPMAR